MMSAAVTGPTFRPTRSYTTLRDVTSHVGGAVRVGSDDGRALSIEAGELLVAIFVGLDVHRAQMTYDALDTDTGR